MALMLDLHPSLAKKTLKLAASVGRALALESAGVICLPQIFSTELYLNFPLLHSLRTYSAKVEGSQSGLQQRKTVTTSLGPQDLTICGS